MTDDAASASLGKILKDYSANPPMKPEYPTLKIASYVLHDPTFRDIEAYRSHTYRKISDASQRDTRPKNKDPIESENGVHAAYELLKRSHPYLFEGAKVVDLTQLEKDKNYYRYYLLNSGSPTRAEPPVLATKYEKTLYHLNKLSGENSSSNICNGSEEDSFALAAGKQRPSHESGPNVIVRRPKDPRQRKQPPPFRVERYGRKPMASGATGGHAAGVTFDMLFGEEGDMKEMLEIAAPARMGADHEKAQRKREERQPKKKQEDDGERLDEFQRRLKKKLINEYGDKGLDEVILPDKIRNPPDIPDAYDNLLKWNMAQFYKSLKHDPHSGRNSKALASTKINLSDLNDRVISRLLPVLASSDSLPTFADDSTPSSRGVSGPVAAISPSEPGSEQKPKASLLPLKQMGTSRNTGACERWSICTTSRAAATTKAPSSIVKEGPGLSSFAGAIPEQAAATVQHRRKSRKHELPLELVRFAQKIALAKQKHRVTKELSSRCEADLDKRMIQDMGEKSASALMRELDGKTTRMSAQQLLLKAREEVMAGGANLSFRGRQEEARRFRDKAKIKPALDNHPTPVAKRLGSTLEKEKLDAYLSRMFYYEAKYKVGSIHANSGDATHAKE